MVYRHHIHAVLLLAAALLLVPNSASAHLVTTGMGPVYDGIAHLTLTPQDLIPAISLALFAGLRGPDHGRRTLFLLPFFWFVGGLAGISGVGSSLDFPAAILFIVLGLLVAGDLQLPLFVTTLVVSVAGMILGLMNGRGLMEGPALKGLMGATIALFVLIAILSATAIVLGRSWKRIGIRVVGGWIVATGVLLLGWMISGQG